MGFLSEAQIPLQSNKARKGDADFGAPSQTKAANIGARVAKEQRKAAAASKRAARTGGTGARQPFNEAKHKRGAKGTHTGGKFVSVQNSGDAPTAEAGVKAALGPQGQGGLAASIRAFQKAHGLVVDGIVGRQTALAIHGQYSKARQTATGALSTHEARALGKTKRRGLGRTASAPRRGGGGALIASDDEDWHGALAEDQPFWDPLLHPHRGHGPGGGQFVKKVVGTAKGLLGGGHDDSIIPTYDPSKLKFGKSAGGSNGARKAHHADGSTWLVKAYGGNENRVATELLANAVYRHVGARVPRAGRIKLNNGKSALAYPMVDGAPRPYVFHKPGRQNAELGRHFMTDALLANWDVAGLEDDNVLWDKTGKPFRVDQGGTLEFRAQGGRKPFGPVPYEVTTMLLPQGQASRSMAVNLPGLRAQADELHRMLTPERIDALVAAAGFRDRKQAARVAGALKARVAWMGDFAAGRVGMPVPPTKKPKPKPVGPPPGLLEAVASTFGWVEHLHPRDQHGKFRDKLSGLAPKQWLHLGGKVRVSHDDGNPAAQWRVKVGNTDYRFQNRGDAVRHALDKSAQDTAVDSVGGTTKHKDYNSYLKSRGIAGVDTVDAGNVIYFGGRTLSPLQAQNTLAVLKQRAAAAPNSDDKYVKRGAATVKARAAELESKLKASPVPTTGQAAAGPSSPGHYFKVGDTIEHKLSGQQYKLKSGDQQGFSATHVQSGAVYPISHAQFATGDFKYAVGGKAPDAPEPTHGYHDLKPGDQFVNSVGATETVSTVNPVTGDVALKMAGNDLKVPGPKAASLLANGMWKKVTQGDGPDTSEPADSSAQVAALEATLKGMQSGDVQHLKSVMVQKSTGEGFKVYPVKDGQTVDAQGKYYVDAGKAAKAAHDLDKAIGSIQTGPPRVPGAEGAKHAPSSKPAKPIKSFQPNPGNPATGAPAPIKLLDLAAGDVVQFKKGGWKYTYLGPAQYGSGHTFQAANGQKKTWAGYAKPMHVQKADGSVLKLKGDAAAPAAPAAPAGKPGVDYPLPVGTKVTMPSGSEATVTGSDQHGVAFMKVGASGPIPWTHDEVKTGVASGELKVLSVGAAGPQAGAAPAAPPKTHAQIVTELKAGLKPGGTANMDTLPDGAVIQTPDGKVAVLKPAEPAYTGYLTAYNVETGAKFEPPANKPPHKVSTEPAAMAAAQAALDMKTSGDGVAAPVPSGSHQAAPAKPAQPDDDWGHLKTGSAAQAALTKAQNGNLSHMTKAQKGAVGEYTGSTYHEINEQLRQSLGFGNAHIEQKIAEMDGVFSSIDGIPEEMVIFRGVKGQAGSTYRNAQVGSIIRDNGFISATPDSDFAHSWAGHSKTVLKMRLPKGTKGLYVSGSGESALSSQGIHEKELILRRGIGFKVLAVRDTKSGHKLLVVEPVTGHL